ncbi:AAA family ATPase [Streptomyces sp. NPDC008122]|uniref:ATP-binding protein n=1 Tax=Streptomyces sp. NPDC008122 TaxID=3364810 RepID=UPI0036E21F25
MHAATSLTAEKATPAIKARPGLRRLGAPFGGMGELFRNCLVSRSEAAMSGLRADRPTPDRRAGFAFVGREQELRSLISAVRDGPAVVFVEGEAGVGKSRLLREVESHLAVGGMPVLRGACHPLREPLPFGPAIDALRGACSLFGSETRFGPATAVLAPHLPELADRLPPAAPEPGTTTHGRLLMRAVHEVLGVLGPAVLMVEDLHWADEATRDLLLLLARNPPEDLRMVLTYRARDLPESGNVLGSAYRRPVGVGGTELTLRPLTAGQVRELATSVIGPAATGPLCRELFERSGGLPLAAEEDLLVLADRLTRAHDAGGPLELGSTAVPRAVQEAVNSRVALLDGDATAMVQAAAVLEVPASEELLAQVAKLTREEAEEALIAALDADVMAEKAPDRYGFRHVLARRAVYDRIPGPRRRRLHARAVEVLSEQEAPALVQIAHHTRRLGDTAAWIPRALAAADHAAEVGDDGVAADLLQQLLAEPTLPPDDRARSALALSNIAVFRADPATSAAILRRIVADPALPTGIRGEIRFNLSRTLTNTDLRRDSMVELEQAIVELEGRPGLAAAAMASLSLRSSLTRTGLDVAECLALMDRAADLITHSDDPVARADVLANQITLLDHVGDPRSREILKQLPRDSTDRRVLRHCARALHNAAYGELARGGYDQAETLLDEAEELCRHTGSELFEQGCRLMRLQLGLARGSWAGLDQRIAEMLHGIAEGGPHRVELVLIQAELDTARGRWTKAREHLPPIATGFDDDTGLMAATLLARLDLLEGDTQAAWQRMEEAVETRRGKGLWAWPVDLVPTAVEAALACGLRDEACRVVDDAGRGIEGLNAPGVAAGVEWCRGMLAAGSDHESALTHLDRARCQYEGIGRVHTVAKVVEQIGRLKLARTPDHPGTAARDLRHALDVFTRLDATADAARCEQALRDSGQLRTGSRGRRSYGTSLSPRERQVAELLATGATNLDIARALALSPRTAEHHVANALRKLGVPRADVRDALGASPRNGA